MDLFARVRPLLDGVQSPAWYIGGEVNEVVKSGEGLAGRIALVYPDCYEVGMSHYGLKILYHLVNRESDLAAERAFTPWPDFADRLRAHRLPLYSLESKRPLRDFDVVGFTIQSELTLSNVLECLSLAQIPLRAAERSDRDPLVIAGGAGAFNPQLLAEVVDLHLLGDGEEILVPFLRDVVERRRRGEPRAAMVAALARAHRFVDAPSLRREEHDANGRLAGYTTLVEGLPERVRGAYVLDLESIPFPTAPVVPHTKVVHDRVSIEVMRGCVHGCRFCQAGMITRPWRIRSPRRLLEIARESWKNTGQEELGLLSLSTSDYPFLKELLALLHAEFDPHQVNVSLPSLRVNEQLRLIPDQNGEGRRGGLTLAPEVATDRLRHMVNKPIRNDDLYRGVREAFRHGWTHVKLYFMVGVPGELESDLDGIVEMAETCSRIGKEELGRYAEVHAAVSTFVPKPFTPYQWDGMVTIEEARARRKYLLSKCRLRSVRIDCHDAEQSLLETVLARGDRRVGRALLRAHELGARFDEWSEHLRFDLWQRAFAETGIDAVELATRTIPYDEALPWDHLDAGPDKEFLIDESRRARDAVATHHCFDASCHQCGVDAKECFDLKRAMPLLPLS
jgi:radical SAM family uncharacterized protein